LLAERQDLEQGQRLLGFLEGSHVLQHGLGLAVLRDDQGSRCSARRQHLGGVDLEVADGFDSG